MQEQKSLKAIFSARLASVMKKQGFTQSKLAGNLGVSQNAVWKWLNGTVPEAATIQNIAEVFKVATSYLIGEDTPSGNQTTADPATAYRLDQPAHLLSARERNAQYAALAYDAALKRKKAGQYETLMQHVAGVVSNSESYAWHRKEIPAIIDAHFPPTKKDTQE